jgi:serine/threonine-protein kinase RsbT
MEAKKIEILTEQDIIAARSAGRDMARDLGFGSADQTRLATAISELTRNIIQYAGKGTCTLSDKSNERAITIQVVAEDSGPGIEDIEQAMEFGFTTSKGLGAGLPSTKRLVSKFDIKSEPGHTEVTIKLTKRKVI